MTQRRRAPKSSKPGAAIASFARGSMRCLRAHHSAHSGGRRLLSRWRPRVSRSSSCCWTAPDSRIPRPRRVRRALPQRVRAGRPLISEPRRGRDPDRAAPDEAPSAYGHVAAFVRHAPEAQRQSLWQAVGDAMARRISAKPVWLSTAGGGISWLHVRLDDRPKYYAFAPYTMIR